MTTKTNSKKYGNKILFIYLNSLLEYKLINIIKIYLELSKIKHIK